MKMFYIHLSDNSIISIIWNPRWILGITEWNFDATWGLDRVSNSVNCEGGVSLEQKNVAKAAFLRDQSDTTENGQRQ